MYILFVWVVITGLNAITPFLSRDLINNTLVQDAFSRIIPLIAGLLIIKTAAIILNFIGEYELECLKRQVVGDFWRYTYEKLQRLSMKRFTRESSGTYISKILADGEMTGQMVAGFLPSNMLNIVRVLVVISILIILNPTLGLISLSFLPVYYLIFTRYSESIIESSQNERIFYANLLESLKEKIEGLPLVIFYQREKFLSTKFSLDISEWLGWIKKVIRNIQKYNASYFYVSSVFPLFIFGLGALLVTLGKIDIGTMIAFFLYVNNLFQPLSNISRNWGALSQAIPPMERVMAILEETDVAVFGTSVLAKLHSVTLDGLSFAYGNKVILDDIVWRLDLNGQSNTAIVGRSGVGKTTLARFFTGYLDSDRCKINGRPITEYSRESLRRHVLLVGQGDFIFNLTVMENLAMGESFSDEEMRAALGICGIDLGTEFLHRRVGEKGMRLSDGERQRLALARAVLRKPALLVLDEALSGVDAEIESTIFKNIKGVIPHLVVISHRLSTILQCDDIYVLDDGKFIAHGSHQELLNSCSVYQSIISDQLS